MSSDGRDPRRSEEELRAFWSGLDLLWDAEAEAAPGRARRRSGLDLGQIVRAAVGIADAEGLEAVSMRRVATKLDTGAMSLYRHVPDKDALVLMMIDATLDGVRGESTPAGSADWRASLRAMADATWKLMRRHTWLPGAMLIRPPLTPNGVAGLEQALGIFDAFDLDIGSKMKFVGAVHFTVISAALNAAIEDRTRERLQASDEEIMLSSAHVIERIAKSGAYPRVMSFIADAEHLGDEAQMRAAVELVIDGIGTHLPSHNASGGTDR
jgi:AcrR family transcriptional regulator